MRKMVNGAYVDLPVEEYQAMQDSAKETELEQSQTPPTPTDAERIAALEEELRAAKILLGLEE